MQSIEELLRSCGSANSAESVSGRGAEAPELIAVEGGAKRGDHFFIVLDFFKSHCRICAVGKFGRIFQLIEPLFLLLMKFGGLEKVPAFVKKHHQRRGVRGKSKNLLGFRDGNLVKLRA